MTDVERKGKMEPTATFQQLNSEFSYMKNSQEVSKLDLQVVENPTGSLLGNFSCKQAVNSDF